MQVCWEQRKRKKRKSFCHLFFPNILHNHSLKIRLLLCLSVCLSVCLFLNLLHFAWEFFTLFSFFCGWKEKLHAWGEVRVSFLTFWCTHARTHTLTHTHTRLHSHMHTLATGWVAQQASKRVAFECSDTASSQMHFTLSLFNSHTHTHFLLTSDYLILS